MLFALYVYVRIVCTLEIVLWWHITLLTLALAQIIYHHGLKTICIALVAHYVYFVPHSVGGSLAVKIIWEAQPFWWSNRLPIIFYFFGRISCGWFDLAAGFCLLCGFCVYFSFVILAISLKTVFSFLGKICVNWELLFINADSSTKWISQATTEMLTFLCTVWI